MTKLRILLACEQPLPSTKRAGRPNYSLNYLSQLGHDITVICPKPSESVPQKIDISLKESYEASNVRFEYLSIGFDQFSLLTRFRIMRSMTAKIRNEAMQNHYDVIRANGLVPSYSSISGSEGKTPVYGEITDVLTDQYTQFDLPFKKIAIPIAKRIQKRVAHDITLASVETPVGRRRWAEMGLKKEKIVVNPNGVDTRHFSSIGNRDPSLKKELGFGDNSRLILLVWHGDISKDDGIECLLKAMPLLGQDFVLAIIGSGPSRYVRYLKDMAVSLNLQGRVVFTGWIDYSRLPKYLDVSDIATAPILPTTPMNQANFFTKVREYIAMNKNIVATETEGLKSMLGDSVVTYVSDPRNVTDLASKITKAHTLGIDEEKRERMQEIAAKIDWENIIKRDSELMSEIVEGGIRDASVYDIKL